MSAAPPPDPTLVAGIAGSPREGGNTDLLLDEALRGAEEGGARTVKLALRRLRIAPCNGREEAAAGEPCAVRDGMREVFAAVRGAGAVVLASPIYFGSVSAQMKTMIDRFQCVWLAEHRRGIRLFPGERVCGFIACAAGDRRIFENARQVVRNWAATAHARLCEGSTARGGQGGRAGCRRRRRAGRAACRENPNAWRTGARRDHQSLKRETRNCSFGGGSVSSVHSVAPIKKG